MRVAEREREIEMTHRDKPLTQTDWKHRLEWAASHVSTKRVFDLTLSVVLLFPALPVAAVVALIVRTTSRGPVIFQQERVGKDGKVFVLYKFRTMYHGADSAIHQDYYCRYREGMTAPGQTRPIFKLHRDPRITPCGGVLRRLAVDELPQLFNVIRGDMSLVGPRPPLAYEVEHYTPRDMLRLSVKPGVTGLWQVRGRDVVDFATMIDLDLDYIERQSFGLDLGIVVATIPALISASIKR